MCENPIIVSLIGKNAYEWGNLTDVEKKSLIRAT